MIKICGKGRSLKDGLKYFFNMKNKNDFIGVITADCDGQHRVEDINKIYTEMQNNDKALFLGTRSFSDNNVPLKSKFGNRVTSIIFKILYGTRISDTQTGLRGISSSLIKDFSNISGERYEYETNMLIEDILRRIQIVEVPIETVYIDNNSNTHFRPIHDSLLIYWKILNSFIKYSAVSIISCIVDILLFKIFLSVLPFKIDKDNLIIVSTVFARVISSLVNYGLNKKVSFNSNKNVSNTILKYYILCIVQMFASGFLVSRIYMFTDFSEVIIKLVVDTILFIVNYRIQRMFIFNE